MVGQTGWSRYSRRCTPTTRPGALVAAAHLRHTADTLTRQSPTRSAFSFGGGALARSYDALHRRTVALLLDGAHSFTAAATHADTARHDTARHDTTDVHDIHPAGDTDETPVTASTAWNPTPEDTPVRATTPVLHALSETARTGLDACLLYIEAVNAGIDTVLLQLPAGTAVAIHDDLTDLRRRFEQTRGELHDVFAAVGDPDALHTTAQTWLHLVDEQASTLTGIVTPATGNTGVTRTTAGTDTSLDLLHAQAAAAAALRTIGPEVHTSLTDLTDAIKIFWATLTAAITAAEAVLAVAAVLAGSPIGAPAALALASTATLQLAGMTTLSLLQLAMADTDAAAPLSALTQRLHTHTATRHSD